MDRSRLSALEYRALWIGWIHSVVSLLRREKTICLASLLDLTARMHKRATSAQRGHSSSFEGPDCKRPKRSSPSGEVQKSPALITIDSPEQAPGALPALERRRPGCPRGGLCIVGGWDFS